jgi:hypothetical protein
VTTVVGPGLGDPVAGGIAPVSEPVIEAVAGTSAPFDRLPVGESQPLLEPLTFDFPSGVVEMPIPAGAIDPVSGPLIGAAGDPALPVATPSDPYLEPLAPDSSGLAGTPSGDDFLAGLGQALQLSGPGLTLAGLAASLALLGTAARFGYVVSSFAGCLSPGASTLAGGSLTRRGASGSAGASKANGADGGTEDTRALGVGVKAQVTGEAAGPAGVSGDSSPTEMDGRRDSRLGEIVQLTLLALSLAVLAAAAVPRRYVRRAAFAVGAWPHSDPRPYLIAVGISLLLTLNLILLAL